MQRSMYIINMARQGNLKHHDGSEVNAVAARTNVKASPRVFTTSRTHPWDFAFPKRSLRKPLYSTSTIKIINVRFIKSYACKCVCLEREASGLHNSWNSSSILRKCIRNEVRRPEIQTFPGGHAPRPSSWARVGFTYCWKPPM